MAIRSIPMRDTRMKASITKPVSGAPSTTMAVDAEALPYTMAATASFRYAPHL